ncbi:MAG: fused response regulator/phosphatase [Proteobacteria bacterium]|nr:fused response regulator/phosphatase [Pseudomonadota bacterium]
MEISNILIVDDNEINRDICALNLEHLKVPLHFAENGRDGLKIAQEQQPDLILLDIMMPVMDGYEMIRSLKADPLLAHIPILMLTAKSETASVVKALDLGANDYLKKPFAEEEMVARVNTLLRNRYLEKRLTEDLAAGARMQQKFLTDFLTAEKLCTHAGLQIDIYNRPYTAISGDFYYCYQQVDGTLGFFIGDSCGHGLPAALISMRVIGFLQQLANVGHSAGEILTLLNDDIGGLLPLGRFVAASSLIFHGDEVTVSNCGQPYPILISTNGIVEIECDGLPLGLACRYEYQQATFKFCSGDKLIVYTDGIIEAIDNHEQIYGKNRLFTCLKNQQASSQSPDFRKAILTDILHFCGNTIPDDDQTMIIFEKK